MRYYHCSLVKHPIGLRLTGPGSRGADSRWSAVEPTYELDRVYVFAGNGDPQFLVDSSVADEPQYVYEVNPVGEPHLDMNGGSCLSMSYQSAVILACVHQPPQERH
jgi:hypothetical protein